MKCWVCSGDNICLPYRSNPKGLAMGKIFMICGECRKRVDARPKRPWINKEE